MSTNLVVVLLSLFSALCFALSTLLKHTSAARGPEAPSLRVRSVLHFVASTVTHPLWLASILADVAGLVLQVIALHLGALAVVQTLLIAGLLFTVLLRTLTSHSPSRTEIGWAAVLVLALGAFLAIAGTSPSGGHPEAVDKLPALIAAAVGLSVGISAVGVAHRLRPAVTGAALLGLVVGLLYATDAALLKACTDQAVHGVLRLVTSWQVYAVIVVGAAGLFLAQLAYQAGPVTASQPTIAAVDPMASVVIGVLIFDEHMRRGPWTGAGLAVAVGVLALAVVRLAREAAKRQAQDETAVAAPL